MINNSEGSNLPPSDLVRQYFNAGFSLLRLNGKTPIEKGWPMKPGLSIEQAINHLDHGNIGMRTGTPSGSIYAIDVDRDWDQFADRNAERLKQVRWIATSQGRGRVLVKGQRWATLGTKQPWGEILGDGHQCVLPPSIHPVTKTP